MIIHKSPIYIILTHLLLLTVTTSIHLTLQDTNILTLNSSMRRQTISISLSSQGQFNTSFFVESEILSPLMNRYQFIHGEKGIVTQPELRDQQVNFNDFDGREYWFAIRNKVKLREGKEVNFVGMRVIDGQNVHQYLLPAFSQPFSFLPIDSIYSCGPVIVSITLNAYGVDMALISKSGQQSWRTPRGDWGWNWAKKEQQMMDIGRYTRKDVNEPIRVELKSDQYCEFVPSELEKSQMKLQRPSYQSIKQVVALSTALQLHQQPPQL